MIKKTIFSFTAIILCMVMLSDTSVLAAESVSKKETKIYIENVNDIKSAEAVLSKTITKYKDYYTVYTVSATKPVFSSTRTAKGSNIGYCTVTGVSEIRDWQTNALFHTITMVSDCWFDSKNNDAGITKCEVSIKDEPGTTARLYRGVIGTTTGSDWASGAKYVQKDCTCSGKSAFGITISGDVYTRIYSDGGYRAS